MKDPKKVKVEIDALKERRDVERLLQLLRERDPVGLQAYHALIGLVDQRAVEPLIAALGNKKARLWAALLLAELKDRRCFEPLVEIALADRLRDRAGPRSLHRLTAARKLADLHYSGAADVLATMVEESIYPKEAVFELAALKDPRAIEPLVAWVIGEDFEGRLQPRNIAARDAQTAERSVPSRAADALGQIGGSVIAPLKAALQRKGGANEDGLRALAKLGDAWAIEELRIVVEAKAAAAAAFRARDAATRTGEPLGRPFVGPGTCDLCSAAIHGGGLQLSAHEMRRAVRDGLRPRGAAANIGAMLGVADNSGWVEKVMQDTTDWALCSNCGSDARAL